MAGAETHEDMRATARHVNQPAEGRPPRATAWLRRAKTRFRHTCTQLPARPGDESPSRPNGLIQVERDRPTTPSKRPIPLRCLHRHGCVHLRSPDSFRAHLLAGPTDASLRGDGSDLEPHPSKELASTASRVETPPRHDLAGPASNTPRKTLPQCRDARDVRSLRRVEGVGIAPKEAPPNPRNLARARLARPKVHTGVATASLRKAKWLEDRSPASRHTPQTPAKDSPSTKTPRTIPRTTRSSALLDRHRDEPPTP